MRESEIERRVCKYAEDLGFEPYKFVSPNRRFVPDRLIICPHGWMFFMEFKKLGEKPTPGQMREIERIRRRNAFVFIIDDVQLGKEVIDGFINY